MTVTQILSGRSERLNICDKLAGDGIFGVPRDGGMCYPKDVKLHLFNALSSC